MAVSKKNMKCNVTRPSTRPGKKRMVKAREGGKGGGGRKIEGHAGKQVRSSTRVGAHKETRKRRLKR